MAAATRSHGNECNDVSLCCGPVCERPLNSDCAPRPQDQIWLISTRCLGCPRSSYSDAPAYEVMRFDPQSGWQDSNLDEFLADDDARAEAAKSDGASQTVFFVHGNRVDRSDAITEGWTVYHRLADPQPDEAPPLRFVIFSWPSDQIHGQIRDVRYKAQRADTDAFYLGWLLSRMNPALQTGFIGYSYGARVVSGGLHVLGGGRSAGAALEEPTVPSGSRSFRVVFFAAAVHRWWLNPGGRNELAIAQVDHLLLLYNTCDPALKRYHVVDKCSHPQALGYLGFCDCDEFGAARSRIEQSNVCSTVGNSHLLPRYLSSDCLMRRVRQEVLRLPAE